MKNACKNYGKICQNGSQNRKSVGTKNLAGNVTSYNISASVNFKVTSKKINKTFQFAETSVINNQNNQLDETIYEEKIKKNLA